MANVLNCDIVVSVVRLISLGMVWKHFCNYGFGVK